MSEIDKIVERANELQEAYTPIPEPTFLELQQQLFSAKPEVVPVIITEKFRDTEDFDNPVKVKEHPAPGFYVRMLGLGERATMAKWVESNDKDSISNVVKLCLCDKEGNQLITKGFDEKKLPGNDFVMSVYDCAMVVNRFFLKKWNPVATIAKN